ncbi:replicative DNA helicase [bacterium M21]|nr:replicative DNA helicase [bacterium M21]
MGPLLVGDQPLPHSPEAECAVLSCLLQDPAATMDLIFGRLETGESMYMPANRRLFEVMREMRTDMPADQIDIIAVGDRLERRGQLQDIGGIDFIRNVYSRVPTVANVENYVAIVQNNWVLRKMIATCSDIVGRCYEAEDEVEDLVDDIEKNILSITKMQSDNESKTLKEVLPEALHFLQRLSQKDPSMMGLRTGYPQLDGLITGLKGGDMFVLAARPSIGKTTFAMNLLRNVAIINEVPVGFFSLEMDARQVVIRLICSEAKVDIRAIRDGKLTNAEWNGNIMEACDRLNRATIIIDDTPQISSLELRQKARRMYTEHGIKCLAIDYLQLMKASGNNATTSREQEVAKMSGDIKALARELDVPIIILAQLNRAAETTGQPKISNLRESGAIEQDADVVALLHRDRETDSEEAKQRVMEGKGIESSLIIAKNRNGATGIVDLIFYPPWTLFDTPDRIDDADVPV